MSRTFIRQDVQIRNSGTYDDTLPAGATLESGAASAEDDLNSIRSQINRLIGETNWHDALVAPTALEAGTIRGIQDINEALHALEKKRVLRAAKTLVDVTVGAADNFVILGAGEYPANSTMAVGLVTTLGTVAAAHAGTFGTHALDEVGGPTAVDPHNLVKIVDGSTGDPILSGGKEIWGLLQSESATDGHTATDAVDRLQISFVVVNNTNDDLIAVPNADIQGKVINYCYRERIRLEDLSQGDFLNSAAIDIGAGATTVSRQLAYDNQGVTPVDLTSNATLDLEGPGLAWGIRDDQEAALFTVTEGSASGTSSVKVESDVDEFISDAVNNHFMNGASFALGNPLEVIEVGVTPNTINSFGALQVQSVGALDLESGGDLNFTDIHRGGSTWSDADGIALAAAPAEWDDFEAKFGEVSLLNAICQAGVSATQRVVGEAEVLVDTAADVDVGGIAGGSNLNFQLPDMSAGDFIQNYDVYVNGQRMRGGLNAAADCDYYPGTSLADGQLKFEFDLEIGDSVSVICFA